jgi:hypothetical protein
MKFHILYILIAAILFSCSKNVANNSQSTDPSTSIWPLKEGNSWIYKDSLFSAASFSTTYIDTAIVTNQTTTDDYDDVFYGIQNPNGWFGTNSYVSVDPTNTVIYQMDSLKSDSYTFFQTAQSNGELVNSYQDFSNPVCITQYNQYGFANTTTINGYACYKNIEYITDCSNITKNVVVTYISPGVGVVRIEDYILDSNNKLYMDYSQTLQSYKINQ